ncbi:MAG: YjbQ family protein [Candidatus Parabeggiatoa sp. nov. 2]|nr:MAG: secondary thiamine-phosphate synthase enzyme [Beggiatoa sp. 4572_84]RKZ61542.1 MAG: YjbQ family protein [Gammaproteobacteria bacterium]
MNIYFNEITLQTGEGIQIYNLMESLTEEVTKSGIKEGMVNIISRHTTTALAVNEYEPRLLDDLRLFFKEIASPERPYKHNDIHLRDCPSDEPKNAHSHILAMLLSSHESVPLVNGCLSLGTWQSVLLFELDGPRQRKVAVQIIGK